MFFPNIKLALVSVHRFGGKLKVCLGILKCVKPCLGFLFLCGSSPPSGRKRCHPFLAAMGKIDSKNCKNDPWGEGVTDCFSRKY